MAISVPIISSFNNDGIRNATRSLEGFAKKSGELAKKAALGIAGIGVGVAAGALKAIDAASNIEESMSKVNVVFGDASEAVIDFSETAAKEFGLSKQAVFDAAGVFGTFGKAAGLSGDDLSTFTTDFIGLASDLASFNNTTPEEAIDAIGAALRGEAEPLRRYGVLLDDAKLRARALELGIYDGEGALTSQQKVLAAQAEIWAQTGDAQGDFARTSDSLANRQRILRAQFTNVIATIGQKLLPIALQLAEFFSNRVIPVIERVADVFSKDGLAGVMRLVVEEIRNALPKLVALLKQAGSALVDWIKPKIVPALLAAYEFLQAVGNWMVEVGFPWLVNKIQLWGEAFVDWIEPRIQPALEALGRFLVAVGDWVVGTAAPAIAEYARPLAQKFTEWTGRVLPKLIAGLSKAIYEIGVWIVTKGVPKFNELGAKLAVGLAKGFLQGLKDAGILKYLGPVGFAIDKFVDASPETPPAPIPIGGGNTSTGGISTLSLAPSGGRMGGNTYITVEGAIDPVSVARQIRTILTDDARRSGFRSVIAPISV